ncbi:MAG: hypothetical protein ACOCP2_02475 [Halohasta sp.]
MGPDPSVLRQGSGESVSFAIPFAVLATVATALVHGLAGLSATSAGRLPIASVTPAIDGTLL